MFNTCPNALEKVVKYMHSRVFPSCQEEMFSTASVGTQDVYYASMLYRILFQIKHQRYRCLGQ